MSNSLKVTIYAVLIIIVSISGYFASTSFGRMMSRAGDRTSELEQIEPERKPAVDPVETNTVTPAATNLATNELSRLLVNTNVANTSSNTNAVVAEQTSAVPAQAEPAPTALGQRGSTQKKGGSHLGVAIAFFVVSLIALGLLIASDVSHFLGNRALKVMFNDEGEGVKDPEYDKAEETWANGDHLEAIKMMREYLQKNPREQHVAIRIAEIYEKDLKNNLAAALEYEEVLQHKLQPDRWGWAAIHLCNLYFRLNQEQKGYALLHRIVNEHPNTGAAEKARKRLEEVGPTERTTPLTAEISVEPKNPIPEAPASNLPPGFRPKK